MQKSKLIAFESHLGEEEKNPSEIWVIKSPAGLTSNKVVRTAHLKLLRVEKS